MANRLITVRAPDGTIGEVPEEEYQTALDAGYQNVSQDEARAARETYAASVGEDRAVSEGVLEAKPGYSTGVAATEKFFSGLMGPLGSEIGLNQPAARAVGQRFTEEHPVASFGAELAGQLPGAVALEVATAGAAPLVAGAGLAARGAFRAGEFGAQAALGGAQTEAEAARLSGEDFNPTNAAIVGVFGEALGRSAAYGFSKGLGFSRNLLARGEQQAVAQDAGQSLARGGVLNDFRVAAHADQYHNELSDLAARDLDALETAFEEVGRQDRKRLRVARVIEDLPETQNAVRIEMLGSYQQLYEGLFAEVGEGAAPAPARRLLDQLRKRMDVLEEAPVGSRLWKQLDENRVALQEYAQDLHISYENAPGSAWLSRDGLRLLDDATRQTREVLLREDAWGTAAAREQAAYNQPFNEKFFPNDKTVRGKLFFESGKNARGFPIFRGDPGKVRQLFTRGADDVDATRLKEQFREWLDGVEAISKAGERDVPGAASAALEAVRRLRKAASHAEFVQSVSERVSRRGELAEVAVGAGAGLIAGGAGGAVFGGLAGQAARGLRLANWVARAARRVGWLGSAESMAKFLGEGALARRAGPNVPTRDLTDDVLDGPVGPSGSGTPPRGPGAPPAAPAGPGGPPVPPPPPGPQAAAEAAPARESLTPRQFDEMLQELRALGDQQAAELAAKLDAGRAELTSAGLVREVGLAPQASGDPGLLNETARVQLLDALENAPRGVSPEALAAKLGLPREKIDELIDELVGFGQVEVDAAGRVIHGELAGFQPAAAELERELGEVAPDLARFVAENKAAIKPAQEQAKQWWESILEGDAPAANPERDAAYLAAQKPRHRESPRLPGAPTVPPPDAPHPYLAEPLGGQGGITAGGFFRGADGQVRYVKFAQKDHQLNEVANTEMYRDFGIESIRFETVKIPGDAAAKWEIGGQIGNILHVEARWKRDPIAIASVKVDTDQWRPTADLSPAQRKNPKLVKEYLRGVPADLVIGNWDISGNPGNVLVNVKTLQVMRLDAGEAGLNSFIPMRGLVTNEWQNFEAALKHRGDDGRPDSLLYGVKRDEAKQILLEEFTKIEKVFADHGGARAYFEKKFPHVKPDKLRAHADQVAENLRLGKENAASLAIVALLLGGAAFGGEGAEEGAPETAAAAAVPGAGFAATAQLFTRARTKLVARVARDLFAGVAEPAVRTAARLAYSRTQLDARRKEIQQWTQNPDELVERVAEGLRDAPPAAFASTSAAMFRTVSFLRDRLPQTGRTSPIAAPGSAPPVSSDAAAKYARYEQAALHTGDALREAAETKYLTPELLETLEALYPDLLAELRVAAYEAVQADGRTATIQSKTQYARLFDGDGTVASPAFSPTAVKAYAYAYEQAAAATAPPAGAGPRPGVSHTAAAVAAPQPWRTG